MLKHEYWFQKGGSQINFYHNNEIFHKYSTKTSIFGHNTNNLEQKTDNKLNWESQFDHSQKWRIVCVPNWKTYC